MMRDILKLRLRTWVNVWTFTVMMTIGTVLACAFLVTVVYPEHLQVLMGPRAIIITTLITIPFAFFVGTKLRENTRLSDELVRLVNRDRLTDVATRDFFFRRMESDPNAYGVSLMVDIDHFKRVNDTHGHYAGDAVIKHVSQVLRDEVRAQDIVCRFGGEEFVVFLHEVSADQGLVVAERMRTAVAASPASGRGQAISVTVSIGGSLKDRLADINISIQQADAALYRAKSNGRNRTVVDWLPAPADESRVG
ncbi:GGDEF domain-containing protein [Sulfitobacter delicatus]|uniref:diguanylate cyclase n=1 Tax=Sulfitobacter delicatus TaxID=218672 RepID=A0A1G7L9T3_9RHOB|nr:GGDEF domain-containing protein [Sulfitobacter delicatus]SDF45769.1 diguanylate cyclase (GGDEF) domain-containing protein [Sulfitobacter delicatus]